MARRKQKGQPKTAKPVTAAERWLDIPLILGVVLFVATCAAHYPALDGSFIWDDDVSLYNNPMIASPNGLYQFWLTAKAPDYWPLTATMTWIEWRLWGKNPMPYHAGNILLHAVAALLLWRVLLRLNIGSLGAFLAALMLAIHPVTVESVAWVSERKNMLSLSLFLLAILVYLRFEEDAKPLRYVLALLIALAAILAKASVVMLPVVLLICAWWRRSRLTQQDIVRTLPFFAMSLVLGLVNIWFQHHHAIGGDEVRPEGIASRIATVGWVVWFYLYKIVLPINLAMIYPRWNINGANPISYLPLLLLIAAFAVLFRYRKGWGRGLLAALGAYIIVLMPVLGLVDMSYARFSFVADHLQYPGLPAALALMGAGLAAIWSWSRSAVNKAVAPLATGLIVMFMLALAVQTWRQASIYQDDVALWSRAIACNDRAWAAYGNRGDAYNRRREFDRAIQDCTKAIELKPDYVDAFANRGIAYSQKHEYQRAISDHSKAIELRPNFAKGYNNRCIAYGAVGEYAQAIRDCSKAIELDPRDGEAYYNRGIVYREKGDLDLAIADYSKAIEFHPRDAEAYYNRGVTYDGKGDYIRAIQDYTKAIELKPDYVEAYGNRAAAYGASGQFDNAIVDCTRVIELQPDHASAYGNRGNAYGAKGDHARAVQDFTRAIALRPNDPMSYYNRALSFFFLKDYDKAWADVKMCRQLGATPSPELIKQLREATGRAE